MSTFPLLHWSWVLGRKDMQLVVSIDDDKTDLEFAEGHIQVSAPTILKFEAIENGTAPELAFEASQMVNMKCKISLDNGELKHAIDDIDIEDFYITEQHPSVWWVNRWSIRSLIEFAERTVAIPSGSKAIDELKLDDKLQPALQNSYMKVVKGGLTVGTDIPL